MRVASDRRDTLFSRPDSEAVDRVLGMSCLRLFRNIRAPIIVVVVVAHPGIGHGLLETYTALVLAVLNNSAASLVSAAGQ